MNTQKGFASILIILIILLGLVVIGGGTYFYTQKTTQPTVVEPVYTETEVDEDEILDTDTNLPTSSGTTEQNTSSVQNKVAWKTYASGSEFLGIEFKYPGDLEIKETSGLSLHKNNSVRAAYGISEMKVALKDLIETETLYSELGKPRIVPVDRGIDGRTAVRATYPNNASSQIWVENNGKTILFQYSVVSGGTQADFDKIIESVKFRPADQLKKMSPAMLFLETMKEDLGIYTPVVSSEFGSDKGWAFEVEPSESINQYLGTKLNWNVHYTTETSTGYDNLHIRCAYLHRREFSSEKQTWVVLKYEVFCSG